MNITSINLLIRFNRAREIFPRVTRVLAATTATAVTSARIERVNSKEPI